MTVYLCEDSLEGILTGVYDAWMSRRGHDNVRLEIEGQGNTMELFCEYVAAVPDEQKVEKVITAIRTKISEEAYEAVYKAALSRSGGRADHIYRFLIRGFKKGPGIVHMLQLPEVFQIFEMCRNLDNEAHLETEFLRFVEMEGDLLVSRIGPKNDVLVLIAPHFADRMPAENWIIYDERRKKAALHPAGRSWFLMDLDSDEWEEKLHKASQEDEYRALWKALRRSITIKERWNPACQRTHMPLRYRAYMPEFDNGLKDRL